MSEISKLIIKLIYFPLWLVLETMLFVMYLIVKSFCVAFDLPIEVSFGWDDFSSYWRIKDVAED
jgi:hypothetical protein